MTYATKKEALENMTENGFELMSCGNACYLPGTYHLKHGEYARPDYKPVYRHSVRGWQIKEIRYYLPSTCNAIESRYVEIVFGEYGDVEMCPIV